MCVFCLYMLLKVVSHYDFECSVHVSDGFPKKVGWGWWERGELHPGFFVIFWLCKAPYGELFWWPYRKVCKWRHARMILVHGDMTSTVAEPSVWGLSRIIVRYTPLLGFCAFYKQLIVIIFALSMWQVFRSAILLRQVDLLSFAYQIH